jgi:hypothetical protein
LTGLGVRFPLGVGCTHFQLILKETFGCPFAGTKPLSDGMHFNTGALFEIRASCDAKLLL